MNGVPRVGFVAVIAALLLLIATSVWRSAPVAAQDASGAQLRLELQNLRYALDLEIRQLRSESERLRLRVQELERLRGLPTAPPTADPAEGSRTADGEFLARRFVVTDEEGRIRAVLGVSDLYGPALMLLDEQGGLAGVFQGMADRHP